MVTRDRERASIVAATLRFTANHWLGGDSAMADEFRAMAKRIEGFVETGDGDYLWACPVCEESSCDEGCPLKPITDANAAQPDGGDVPERVATYDDLPMSVPDGTRIVVEDEGMVYQMDAPWVDVS